MGLPVEHEHGPADVVPRPADEVVGLARGVVAAGVVVQAEALAPVRHAPGLRAPTGVLEADALADLDDGEVVLRGAGHVRGLPAGHVDADHVGHGDRRRTREQHGEQRRDEGLQRLAFVLESAHSFSFLCGGHGNSPRRDRRGLSLWFSRGYRRVLYVLIDLGAVAVAAEAVVAVVDELCGLFGGVVGDAVVGDMSRCICSSLHSRSTRTPVCMASDLRR